MCTVGGAGLVSMGGRGRSCVNGTCDSSRVNVFGGGRGGGERHDHMILSLPQCCQQWDSSFARSYSLLLSVDSEHPICTW